MTTELLTHLNRVIACIKAMREKLPEVNTQDLAELNEMLASLDISGAEEHEVSKLNEAVSLLGDQIQETMKRLNQYCDELQANLKDLDNHSTGVKAYAVAQGAN